MSIENLSDEQIRALEAQKKSVDFGPSGIHPDRPDIENLSDEQIRALEARKKSVNFGPSGIHPDRLGIENLSDEQIRALEAQKKSVNFGPSGIHPDRPGIENLSDEQMKGLESIVSERRKTDIPYKKYFNDLVNNPNITDDMQFENAVIRSMQSNEIIRTFVSSLTNKIYEKITELKSIDKTDKINAEKIKVDIEKLMNIYVKYLYKLKEHQWNFKTIGFDVHAMKISDDLLDDLRSLQRKFDFSFYMPIPADLGNYYGHKFERNGKLIPGLNMIYEDLIGKEVNWHQVLIYKENELTPYQRFLQSEKLKAFEKQRSAEMSSVLSKVQEKINTSGRER